MSAAHDGATTGSHQGRPTLHRGAVERRIVAAARIALSGGGELDDRIVNDISEAAGIHPYAVRQIFPTNDDLFEAVHAALVEECASRLQAGVDRFRAQSESLTPVGAARALAEAWPIDRGGVTLRADRRARALAAKVSGPLLLTSERRFLQALLPIVESLIEALGREFNHSAALATRVILDTFERSFEAWILEGNADSRFSESPYVRRTLPALLELLSSPSAGPGELGFE